MEAELEAAERRAAYGHVINGYERKKKKSLEEGENYSSARFTLTVKLNYFPPFLGEYPQEPIDAHSVNKRRSKSKYQKLKR